MGVSRASRRSGRSIVSLGSARDRVAEARLCCRRVAARIIYRAKLYMIGRRTYDSLAIRSKIRGRDTLLTFLVKSLFSKRFERGCGRRRRPMTRLAFRRRWIGPAERPKRAPSFAADPASNSALGRLPAALRFDLARSRSRSRFRSAATFFRIALGRSTAPIVRSFSSSRSSSSTFKRRRHLVGGD